MLEYLKSLSPQQQQQIVDNLHTLPEREKGQLVGLLEEIARRKARTAAQGGFLDFVRAVYPGWVMGRHHKVMADAFEKLERGEITRLAISMPPRFSKSEFASYMLPAWYLGKHPGDQVIEASHTADLAIGFGRKVRNLIDSEVYQNIFPGISLQQDSKSAGRWGTSQGGVYNAIGVGGAMAGKGSHLCVLDDPFSEQTVKSGGGEAVFEEVWQWYQTGPRQRLQPGGRICVVHTRWAKNDLIGRLMKFSAANPESDQWTYIELPAILPSGASLWPEFWKIEELLKIKGAIAPQHWNAQYMQTPTGEEGAIIKRGWWKNWEKPDPPECSYILMSLDAAQETHSRADYNALTIWGLFEVDGPAGKPVMNIMLLDAIKKRMEFPELKRTMLDQYKKWSPDCFLVEKKSNGSALYQEFAAAGIPVSPFTPGKGQDKIARGNAVSDMFSSGIVWAPMDKMWAQEVVEECQEFPGGANDDLYDSVTMAMMRIRKGGFIRLEIDEVDEEMEARRRVGADGRFY